MPKFGMVIVSWESTDMMNQEETNSTTAPSQLFNHTMLRANATYADVAENFTDTLAFFSNYYLQFSPKVFTADYGLYWFDYKANYSSIFAEFVGNESRERHIALCRGAADALARIGVSLLTGSITRHHILNQETNSTRIYR